MEDSLDIVLASAYVRGMARAGAVAVPEALLEAPLERLTEAQMAELVALGRRAELKLYYFKRKQPLPRVKKALGFLRAVQPESLLDVGSGRGVFLFPFLEAFPGVPVTSVDLLERRVALMQALRDGGVERLSPMRQDITRWDAPEGAFDVVTLLEVLEHIPDVQAAVRAVVRLARERALALLRDRTPFVWNATSLTGLRSKWVELFERYGARVRIVFLETGWEENLRRNGSRAAFVPEDVIGGMLDRLEPPERWEADRVEWLCT